MCGLKKGRYARQGVQSNRRGCAGPWGANPHGAGCGELWVRLWGRRGSTGSQPGAPGRWCLGQINLAAESRLSGGGRNQGSQTSQGAVGLG